MQIFANTSFLNIYSVGRTHKWFLNEVKFAPVKNGYTARKDGNLVNADY